MVKQYEQKVKITGRREYRYRNNRGPTCRRKRANISSPPVLCVHMPCHCCVLLYARVVVASSARPHAELRAASRTISLIIDRACLDPSQPWPPSLPPFLSLSLSLSTMVKVKVRVCVRRQWRKGLALCGEGQTRKRLSFFFFFSLSMLLLHWHVLVDGEESYALELELGCDKLY